MSGAGPALPFSAELEGRLLRRYKRFFADVELEDGSVVTAHCPNPGSMRGLNREGLRVRCSSNDDPKRKLRHSLEMVRIGRIWVGVNTARANPLVAKGLAAGAIPGLDGYAEIRPEVRVPDSKSRLDFRLSQHPDDARPCWVEVKSVTLAEEPPLALFPDSVTSRGRRHAEELGDLVKGGERAVLLFLVQRADCDAVAPAEHIDPDYAAALREAAARGVEVKAVRARVGARGIRLETGLTVRL